LTFVTGHSQKSTCFANKALNMKQPVRIKGPVVLLLF
jgi:hypothetical protein